MEIKSTIYAQSLLGRTPKGRLVTEYGVNSINAALEDEKNYDAEAVLCKNCGIIISGLLIPDGCPNCGGVDMTLNIPEDYILGVIK